MIFFDRSMPRSIADALKAVRRDDVMWLEDAFPHNTKDSDWLPEAGRNGWLVIARDKRIKTRPRERDAVIEHGVGLFVFNQKHDPTKWEYFKLLGLCLDEMERLFAETPRPFIFVIDRAGRILPFDLAPRQHHRPTS